MTQRSLTDFTDDNADGAGLEELTEAERDVYVAVEMGDRGVRDLARDTDRSPGTVGNLLARAREKIDVDTQTL